MQTRRNFIKTTGVALAVGMGGFYLPKWSAAQSVQNTPGPGVQLYTFHDIIEHDVPGTLKKISELGVKNIESAFSTKGDYYGMKASDFASLLRSLGMNWRSHHVFGAPIKLPKGLPPLKNLRENLQQIIDDASEGGLKYLVAAHLSIGTAKEIDESLTTLNNAADSMKKTGIQLLYHNEPADFNAVEGRVPYEVFLKETDPEILKFELDIAWAIKGGQDPLKLFERYPGRFPLWHIKDLDSAHTAVLPLGDGVLDYHTLFRNVKAAGMKYYFLEHEVAADPFASIGTSIADLKKIV